MALDIYYREDFERITDGIERVHQQDMRAAALAAKIAAKYGEEAARDALELYSAGFEAHASGVRAAFGIPDTSQTATARPAIQAGPEPKRSLYDPLWNQEGRENPPDDNLAVYGP